MLGQLRMKTGLSAGWKLFFFDLALLPRQNISIGIENFIEDGEFADRPLGNVLHSPVYDEKILFHLPCRLENLDVWSLSLVLTINNMHSTDSKQKASAVHPGSILPG